VDFKQRRRLFKNYCITTGQENATNIFLLKIPRFSSLIENKRIKSNQIKSNQIKSNQIKSNQIKSNQIKSKSNQIKSAFREVLLSMIQT